jgi:hypothetical protein
MDRSSFEAGHHAIDVVCYVPLRITRLAFVKYEWTSAVFLRAGLLFTSERTPCGLVIGHYPS